nr:fibronectin type III domain-containing protein [Oceanusvirus sp.]
MSDPVLDATVHALLPPSNPKPSTGDVANLQRDDDTTALWMSESQRPVTVRYSFSNAVDVTGYTVAPPASFNSGAPGWEISMYRHGMSTDAWNRVYHGAQGALWSDSNPVSFDLDAGDVGVIDVTFGVKQRFDQVGFSRFFFRGDAA